MNGNLLEVTECLSSTSMLYTITAYCFIVTLGAKMDMDYHTEIMLHMSTSTT